MSGSPHRMKDCIAIVCRDEECSVAMVTVRFSDEDPPSATSMRLYCDAHEQEGDVPSYFNVDGDEVWMDHEGKERVMQTGFKRESA